jgi:hypothetical protein
VGGDDDSRAELVQRIEQMEKPRRHVGIDIARRLVGDKQLGLCDHGARDRDSLLLPARKRRGACRRTVGKPDPVQHFRYRPLDLPLRFAFYPQGKGYVVESGQMGNEAEILEYHANAAAIIRQVAAGHCHHIFAEEPDEAAAWSLREIKKLEQRCLSRPGWPGEEIEAAAPKAEAEVRQRLSPRAVTKADIFKPYDGARDQSCLPPRRLAMA